MVLKADPSLEGNVADGKGDPSACHQLGLYLSCSIFKGQLAPWTTNRRLDMLDFLEKFLAQWLQCSGKQSRVASGR